MLSAPPQLSTGREDMRFCKANSTLLCTEDNLSVWGYGNSVWGYGLVVITVNMTYNLEKISHNNVTDL